MGLKLSKWWIVHMVGTLFLMIKFIFKVDGQIETMHDYNRATGFRSPTYPPPGLKNYKVFKSQITKTQIALQWAIRMQET